MDTPQNSDGRGQAQQQGGAPSAGSSSNGWNLPRSDSGAQGRQQQAPYGAQGGPGSPSSFGAQPSQAPSAGQAPYGGSTYGFGQQSQVRQSAAQPYAGQRFGAAPEGNQNERFAGQQGAGAQVVEQGSEPKNKRKVGMGTALAMMLVEAIAVGGVTGAVVGKAGDDKSSTSTVNEVLERQPVANSTGNEPAAGSVEDVASKVLPSVVSIYSMTRSGGAAGSG